YVKMRSEVHMSSIPVDRSSIRSIKHIEAFAWDFARPSSIAVGLSNLSRSTGADVTLRYQNSAVEVTPRVPIGAIKESLDSIAAKAASVRQLALPLAELG